jgi:hypothetical protein
MSKKGKENKTKNRKETKSRKKYREKLTRPKPIEPAQPGYRFG